MMKKYIKYLIFVVILFVFIWKLQNILTPKWSYPRDIEDHYSKVVEYKNLEKDSIQAIITGTSHVLYAVDPMYIYEEYGISTYNLAISGMRLSTTYYHLKNMLQYQAPRVVMLDVSALFIDSFYDASWRFMLDSDFPLNIDKIEAIREYVKESLNEKNVTYLDRFNTFLGVALPLYNYHDRWSSLSDNDFYTEPHYNYYGKGYALNTKIVSGNTTKENINLVAADLLEKKLVPETIWENGLFSSKETLSADYRTEPSETQIEWLKKIHDLCDEKNIELVIFKVPVNKTPREYVSSWTEVRSNSVKRIAEELGIYFYDLMYDTDLNINLQMDYRDGGEHMNYNGAVKTSHCLGDFLTNKCGLEKKDNPEYERDIETYNNIKWTATLELTYDWKDYISRLSQNMSGKTIVLAVNGNVSGMFTQSDLEVLKRIGLKAQFAESNGQSYVGIIKDGESIYESFSGVPVTKTLALDNKASLTVKSVGSLNTSLQEEQASIMISGTEYAPAHKGLCIAVYDHATQMVVDQVCFYKTSYDSDAQCIRDTGKADNEIRAYQHRMYNLEAGVWKD